VTSLVGAIFIELKGLFMDSIEIMIEHICFGEMSKLGSTQFDF